MDGKEVTLYPVETPRKHRAEKENDEGLLRSMSKMELEDRTENPSATTENMTHKNKRPAPSPAFSPSSFLLPQYQPKRPSHHASPAILRQLKFTPVPSPTTKTLHFETNGSQELPETFVDVLNDELATKCDIQPQSENLLLIYPKICLDHHNGSHQENRRRLIALCEPGGILRLQHFQSRLDWMDDDIKPARLSDLLRVHDHEYIAHLQATCAKLPKEKNMDYDATGNLDFDTLLCAESFQAARVAAGAVCTAVDEIMTNKYRKAFVAARPPGHHAGPNGCVPSAHFHSNPEMCSCGFCLVNNVAIGAAYLLNQYGNAYTPLYSNPVNKVAIIDLDIHHGNGTEEIIRNLIPHRKKYPLPGSWAPQEFSCYKPWKNEDDIDNVFFASVHLYDGHQFYPLSGEGPHGDSPELKKHKNIMNIALDVIGPTFLEEREKLSAKARKAFMIEASENFRTKIVNLLVPALREFNPDFIFLSSGFDGHADDFYYFLTEDDYKWVTLQMQQVANDCANGRLLSVLEGGYNVDVKMSPRKSTKRTPRDNSILAAEIHKRKVNYAYSDYGSLARSCAGHVEALVGL